MVMEAIFLEVGSAALFAAPSIDPVLERLDPPRRAAVVMALLGLTLVGLFLITTILVGGHWVRRLARHRPAGSRRSERPPRISELQESLDATLPDMKKGDTMLIDRLSKDTKVDG
jgi:hypothetical protein